ncbi:MAG: Sau3AI family type II restriction endonuclease [Acholeplasmataceae bacterium]
MDGNNSINYYKTINDVLRRLEETYGHTFKDYDINHRLNNPKNKGALGNIVEEGIFGYKINSSPEADLAHLGLEIKTTAVIQNKNNSYRAKERLTLESLNYFKVIEQDFDNSDLWNKIKKMLLVIYEYVDGLNYGDMKIVKGIVHEFDEEDLMIIKRDYQKIVDTIKKGKAHELSESDTLYLGACTAGTGKLQSQPFSNLKAKQRKFSLKNSYITQLIRHYVSKTELEHIANAEQLLTKTFEEIVEERLKKYYGQSEFVLSEMFDLNSVAKSKFELLIAKMLGIQGKVNQTDEFAKANITLKTIRVLRTGKIKESMSFPAFSFEDIVNKTWEECDFRFFLESQKFLFAIFEEVNGEFVFKRIKFWNMPESLIENDFSKVYNELKSKLKSGDVVKTINHKGVVYNNFPGIKFNQYFHVRPHARTAKDTDKLPVPDKKTGVTKFTKQCFWLNNDFVAKIIND